MCYACLNRGMTKTTKLTSQEVHNLYVTTGSACVDMYNTPSDKMGLTEPEFQDMYNEMLSLQVDMVNLLNGHHVSYMA